MKSFHHLWSSPRFESRHSSLRLGLQILSLPWQGLPPLFYKELAWIAVRVSLCDSFSQFPVNFNLSINQSNSVCWYLSRDRSFYPSLFFKCLLTSHFYLLLSVSVFYFFLNLLIDLSIYVCRLTLEISLSPSLSLISLFLSLFFSLSL